MLAGTKVNSTQSLLRSTSEFTHIAFDPHCLLSPDTTSFSCGLLHRVIHNTAACFPWERAERNREREKEKDRYRETKRQRNKASKMEAYSFNLFRKWHLIISAIFYSLEAHTRGKEISWTWKTGVQEHWGYLEIVYSRHSVAQELRW